MAVLAFFSCRAERARFGIALTLIAVAWFVVPKVIVMPWVGSWRFSDVYSGLIWAEVGPYLFRKAEAPPETRPAFAELGLTGPP